MFVQFSHGIEVVTYLVGKNKKFLNFHDVKILEKFILEMFIFEEKRKRRRVNFYVRSGRAGKNFLVIF